MSVVIRSYRISTRGPGWTARSLGGSGRARCVLSSVIELRERGEQLPTTRSPSNSKVLAELSRPNLAIVSRARSCSRNCARFGATIGRAVRTSCSSLARRPDQPIVRVSSSQKKTISLFLSPRNASSTAPDEKACPPSADSLTSRCESLTRANRPLSSCAVGPCGASPRQRASRRAATVRRRRGLVWVVVWWLSPSQPSWRPAAAV